MKKKVKDLRIRLNEFSTLVNLTGIALDELFRVPETCRVITELEPCDYCVVNTNDDLIKAGFYIKSSGTVYSTSPTTCPLYGHVEPPERGVVRFTVPNKSEIAQLSRSFGIPDEILENKELFPKLLKHQIEFFDWWNTQSRRGIGALGMGLGKTYLGAYMCYKNVFSKRYKNILIVTLAQVIPKWKEELGKFGVTYNHWVDQGAIDLVDYRPTLLSFEAIRTRRVPAAELKAFERLPILEQLSRDIRPDQFDLVIVDESHGLNNHQSINYKVLSRVVTSRTNVLFFSGTPFSNGLQTCFSQLNIVKPGIVGKNISEFRNLFLENVSPSPKYFKWAVKKHTAPALQKLIYSKTYFKDIMDDLELPELTIASYPYELTDEQKLMYETIWRTKVIPIECFPDMKDDYPEGIPLSSPTIGINLLRRICSGFMLYNYKGKELEYSIKNEKEDLLLYAINKVISEGKQALVWINYIHTGDRLFHLLKKSGIRVGLVNGQISSEEKAKVVKEFLSGALDIVVAHPKSLGTGIDLINAQKQFFYETTYSLTEYSQALKRSHRIGQTNPVTIYRFHAKGTLESAILRALDAKQEVETYLFDTYWNAPGKVDEMEI